MLDAIGDQVRSEKVSCLKLASRLKVDLSKKFDDDFFQ
jgi:hypothetical protein